MLNELIFFEVRIFRTFCEKLQVSSADTNKLFETYGIWKYIEDTYDMLRLNSDECAVKDILVMLKVKGIKLEGKICNKPETVNDKISEQERFCADLILTDAIMDMADEEEITLQEARNKIINSNAYAALYDFETGLWETGPDYFRYFYKTWSINE
ncbi:DUF3791 domain-containing protein [uncultured Phascolarctobacterium sp.]|uniref:DUF3791 domain-containing protein n=1 Tax=uncultured Phascolarctobacterium sp. TaxID=512296 RepID=UPI0025E31645|nr:DUF3791 domain-containing protein [uncultured Phascolarctobacterium sp.]